MEKEKFLKDVITRVPAYSDFLTKQNIDKNSVFKELPLSSKKEYLLKYKLHELCWDATFEGSHIIGASSGFSKTGVVFWPKRPIDESGYLRAIELNFIDHYAIDTKKTLIIISLAFGSWIGGMQIASTLRQLASQATYQLTIATPGLNIAEAVDIYEQFAKGYEQVLIITNPSNVNLFEALFKHKEIVIPPASIYFPVVGEYFSEVQRESVAKTFGHPKDELFCLWTGYGSADTGDLGVETSSTIELRKFFHKNPKLSKEFFKIDETPMLLSLSPHVFIEIIDEKIVVSKDQLIPLVRYNTQDSGGLFTKKELVDIVDDNLLQKLPEEILFVYGRASDAIIFYGTNLLISDIKGYFLSLDSSFNYAGLFEVREKKLQNVVVFEFTIFTHVDEDTGLAKKYQKSLLSFLKQNSHEFSHKYDPLSSSIGKDLIIVKLENIINKSSQIKHHYIIKE